MAYARATQEQFDHAKRLFAQGESSRRVAAAVGCTVTMASRLRHLEALPIGPGGAANRIPLREVSMEKLSANIVLPDWERALVPLFRFKGTKPFRVRAMRNAAIAMFVGECETFAEGSKLLTENTDARHLCGIHSKAVQNIQLMGLFARLRATPSVTGLIPGFREYVESLAPAWDYQQVPAKTKWKISPNVWWRQHESAKAVWKSRERAPVLQYPFVRERVPSNDLLMQVHGLIPKHVSSDIKADLCQDLLVAILAGECTLDGLEAFMPKFLKRARELAPERYGHVSMSSMLGDTDREVGDLLVADDCCDIIPDYLK